MLALMSYDREHPAHLCKVCKVRRLAADSESFKTVGKIHVLILCPLVPHHDTYFKERESGQKDFSPVLPPGCLWGLGWGSVLAW